MNDPLLPDELIDMFYDDLVAIRPERRALETMSELLGADAVMLRFSIATGAGAWLAEIVGREDLFDDSGLNRVVILTAAGEGWELDCARLAEAPFDEQAEDVFLECAAHVRRAMRLRERLLENGAAVHAVSGTIDRLGMGAMIVRGNGRLIQADARANAILKERDGLSLVGDRLTASSAADKRALDALLRAVADNELPSGAISLSRPSGRPALGLAINRPPASVGGGAIGLVVSIRDSGAGLIQSVDALRDLYGLTGTEATLVGDLVNGGSVQETEERRGISHNTMRAHLRSIYAKVGVGRLSEMIHLVSSGTGPLAQGRTHA
ncbi:helix-turn-helix transcriptional regulator [Novosphingobium sp. Chol11]|uniref:helix-turn-helix transcriptional regulator n=1 Tax=Novosphingobium sp. Chol11 TaxID=1385763 RepID=UPI0011416E82|nr:response regulator transcription factor [Novosphingobium sp. Chol11]